MASTFSQTLRLELIGDGDQSGIWGQTTNTNLGTLLEQAITGVVNITMIDANYTLTNFNGVSDEARNAVLVVGGTNNAVRDIIAPLVEKLYVVKNSTVGGYAVIIRGSSGASVSVPSGATVWVYCDGTNFNAIGTETVGNFEVNGNLLVTGNTNAVAATYTGNVAALNISTANVAATGNVTATGNISATGNATATNFIGAGLTLTSINASNISAGTISNARTTASSSNGASTIVTRDANGSFAANVVTAGSVSSSGTVSGSSFSGAGTGLTGTASSLSIGGNAGTATSPQSGGSFITSSNIGSQSVNYATTSGITNSLNSSTVYTPGGINVVNKAMLVGTGGGGGDCQVLLDNNGNVGQIAAVNLANSAYRWLQVGVGSPVLIGAAGVAGGASLTVGQSNGNGTIFASSALANNETGYAMVNGDACFGQFYYPNAGQYFAVNLLGSTIGISFFFSDIRSKKNITPTQEEILPLIDKIEFIDYVSKSRKEGEESKQPRQIGGVSAQQLQTIKPTWVEELDDGGLMLNAQLMLTNAYKAIQELSSKVAKLEAKIAALEAK